MISLTSHLRPAPYPYGLLTSRLLGKLGGKNRRFLRNPTSFVNGETKEKSATVNIECEWNDQGDDAVSFQANLPLKQAVETLQLLARTVNLATEYGDDGEEEKQSREMNSEFPLDLQTLKWKDYAELAVLDSSKLDLRLYAQDVVNETREEQAQASFTIVFSSLAAIIDAGESNKTTDDPMQMDDKKDQIFHNLSRISTKSKERTQALKLIVRGFVYASVLDVTKGQARKWFNGLISHVLALITRLDSHIKRIDANGSLFTDEDCEKPKEETTSTNDGDAPKHPSEKSDNSELKNTPLPVLGSLQPFGYYQLDGPFQDAADPFVVLDAVCELLGEDSGSVQNEALERFSQMVESAQKLNPNEGPIGTEAIKECILASICRHSNSVEWNLSSSFQNALKRIIGVFGDTWCRRFEVEIVNVALFSVKTVPREIPYAGVKAFQFFTDVLAALYGKPMLGSIDTPVFLVDLLRLQKAKKPPTGSDKPPAEQPIVRPCSRVVHNFICDLASTKHLTR